MPRQQVWTNADNQFIRENAGKLKDSELATALSKLAGREVTLGAVRLQRSKLGIKKEPGRGVSRIVIDVDNDGTPEVDILVPGPAVGASEEEVPVEPETPVEEIPVLPPVEGHPVDVLPVEPTPVYPPLGEDGSEIAEEPTTPVDPVLPGDTFPTLDPGAPVAEENLPYAFPDAQEPPTENVPDSFPAGDGTGGEVQSAGSDSPTEGETEVDSAPVGEQLPATEGSDVGEPENIIGEGFGTGPIPDELPEGVPGEALPIAPEGEQGASGDTPAEGAESAEGETVGEPLPVESEEEAPSGNDRLPVDDSSEEDRQEEVDTY